MLFPTKIEEARFQTLRRSLAAVAHLIRDRDVLDFGASYALSMCAIHELGARSVIGTEPDILRVNRGNETLLRLGHMPTIIHTGYEPYIPLADASFDVVLANAVLEHIPQPREDYIKELWRVLRAGGYLIINETPNKYLPWDFHTTKLPLINWLPSRIAHVVAEKFGRLHHVKDPWEASGWRGLGYFELAGALSNYSLVPEAVKIRHRCLSALGLPASILDPYPLWIFRKH
jgi:SAM-dependent methyltransferase